VDSIQTTQEKVQLWAVANIPSLMMEAVRTSETSVDNHFTRQYNPEDSSEHHSNESSSHEHHLQGKGYNTQRASCITSGVNQTLI
jgi:hypothetical protein